MNNNDTQRNTNHAKGTTIVLFKWTPMIVKGTTIARRERQLFHSNEQQLHSKEQQSCEGNESFSIQMKNKYTQRNNSRVKGRTVALFKWTTMILKGTTIVTSVKFLAIWLGNFGILPWKMYFFLNLRLISHQLNSFNCYGSVYFKIKHWMVY